MLDLNIEKNNNDLATTSTTNFNLSVDRSNLLKALAHVQSVVEKRNIIPILSNVKLIAKAGKLELTATDMDIAVSDKITAYISEEGSLTLPAHTLYDIVRKLPDGSTITFKTSLKYPGKVDIFTENCSFSLPFLDASDFPSIDQGIMPFTFKLSSSEIKFLIDKNKFAISTEETRYNLNGIYLHTVEENGITYLRAVATDGHRLSLANLSAPQGAEKIPGIIIPRKAINEIRKIIDDTDGEIQVELSETKIKFSFSEINFVTKLIDANFPEYQALIPKQNNLTVTVNKSQLNQAVDRVTTITFEKTRAVKLNVKKNELILTVVNESKGEAKEVIACTTNIEDLSIGFNSRYIMDVMAVIEGESAEFSFSDSTSPSIFKDKADSSALYVIMPMRI